MLHKLPVVRVKLVMGLKKNFIAFLVLTILTGCASNPRYTSSPVERRNQPSFEEEGEGEKETLSFEAQSETGIDQAKMGKIIECYLGTRYKEGGTGKKGMDCSGFVIQVYKEYAGFDLPHDSKRLFKLVRGVDEEKLRYGDLVFFSDSEILPSHVGIYIGEGRFVHSTKGYGVIVSSLEEDRYRKTYMGARRVIP
jgi:cell wall-associated NlpC family hydrolase